MVNDNKEFRKRNKEFIAKQGADPSLLELTKQWFRIANSYEYSYHYDWLSRPIIQYPQDIMALQELIWRVKPDLIIETGIAHGGSLILSASLLAMLDYCEAVETRTKLDPLATHRRVVGIDIDIRPHNREAIEAHPMSGYIDMIQGSSIAPDVIAQVRKIVKDYERVLVCLDSNHTHDHVMAELKAYAPLTSKASYCVVFDTIIEDLPDETYPNRPWGKGNNPKTAVWKFLKEHPEFEIDTQIDHKLLISSCA